MSVESVRNHQLVPKVTAVMNGKIPKVKSYLWEVQLVSSRSALLILYYHSSGFLALLLAHAQASPVLVRESNISIYPSQQLSLSCVYISPNFAHRIRTRHFGSDFAISKQLLPTIILPTIILPQANSDPALFSDSSITRHVTHAALPTHNPIRSLNDLKYQPKYAAFLVLPMATKCWDV